MKQRQYPDQSVLAVGVGGKCPRCGEGSLFGGFLGIKKSCRACGLDYSFTDSADGPAVFIILLVGFIVGALFLFVELTYQPPYWVHALLWGPLILILSLLFLRPMKGMMIALQYKNQAAEGRLSKPDDDA